jgi:hypothetical protein
MSEGRDESPATDRKSRAAARTRPGGEPGRSVGAAVIARSGTDRRHGDLDGVNAGPGRALPRQTDRRGGRPAAGRGLPRGAGARESVAAVPRPVRLTTVNDRSVTAFSPRIRFFPLRG